ncbi:MAG TPA: cob(I)yrinic acid a,c-diamide adenosyltransferase [Ruminiclostridium sp.]|nr:cob(I)yrinic acid a,c-diamide adenosyltransferase [Ruminiclostridium sp.]
MNGCGLIHIYTGDGKGKTSSAVGLCVRAAGSGLCVLFAQFLKGRATGEIEPLKTIGISVVRSETVTKFVPYMTEQELNECRSAQNSIFETVKKAAQDYDVVVLDEIFGAVTAGMVGKEAVLNFLHEKPKNTEVILTGRDAASEFIELADYVSEIKQIKHPYEKGIKARKGIEY